MHAIVAVLVVAAFGYLAYRTFRSQPGRPVSPVASAATVQRRVAFLSSGQIFVREPGGKTEPLDSPYVQEAIDRRERARERNSWKQGTSFRIAAGGGTRDFEPSDRPIVATSATSEPGGSFLYFLQDESIGGLFRRDLSSGVELRVLSRKNLKLSDLSVSPDGTLIAASAEQSTGSANIALLGSDGGNYREVTGGDSVDSAPAWIPGAPRR